MSVSHRPSDEALHLTVAVLLNTRRVLASATAPPPGYSTPRSGVNRYREQAGIMRPFRQLAFSATVASLTCSLGTVTTLQAQVQPDSLQRRTVQYRNGDVVIAATLITPAGALSAAGVVIVHGSGASTRDNPWTTAYADALARRGIAVLYPDKRGSGESTGDWRDASISDLANDVLAGIAFLRAQSAVDTTAIGTIAFSQGGYVAAVVAAGEPAVAFTAVISGGTATLRDQIVDELTLEAERTGQPLNEAAVRRLRQLYGILFNVARDRRGWTSYIEAVTEAKAGGGPLAYALRTMPVDSTHWVLDFLQKMGDFDPMPYWNRVATPAVFLYGGLDTQVRIDNSVRRLRSSPSRDQFIVITLGGNGHALFRDDMNAFLVEWMRSRGKDR
jgi:uncharacterized protein